MLGSSHRFNFAATIAAIFLAGCATVSVQMQESLKAGEPEEAATIGREWLKNWPSERNSPDGKTVRRLTAEASFETAKRKGTVTAFQAYRDGFTDEPLARDLVRQAYELEATAALEKIVSSESVSSMQIQSFVTRYARAEASKTAQRLLASALWKEMSVAQTSAGLRGFRETFVPILGKDDPLIAAARGAELKVAFNEAQRAGTVAAWQEYRRRYATEVGAKDWLEKSQQEEIETAFRTAVSAKSAAGWTSFIGSYEQNPAAVVRIGEARSLLEDAALADAAKLGFAGLERFALDHPGDRAAQKLNTAISAEVRRVVDQFLAGKELTEDVIWALVGQARSRPAAQSALAAVGPEIRAYALSNGSAPGLSLAKLLQPAEHDVELEAALEAALWKVAAASEKEEDLLEYLAESEDRGRARIVEDRLALSRRLGLASDGPFEPTIESIKLGQRRPALTVAIEHQAGLPGWGISNEQFIVSARDAAVSGLKVEASSNGENAEIVLVVDPAHLREANLSGLPEALATLASRLVLAGMPWTFSAYSANHPTDEVVERAADQRVVASRIGMLWDACDDCEEEEDGEGPADDVTSALLRGVNSFRNKSRRLLILGSDELRAAEQGLASLEGRADNGLCYTDAKVTSCLELSTTPTEAANCARLTNKIPAMGPLIVQMDACIERLASIECVSSTLERFHELAASCGSSRTLDRKQRGLLATKIKRSGASVLILADRNSQEMKAFQEQLETLDVAAVVAHSADELASALALIGANWTETYRVAFDAAADLEDEEIKLGVVPRYLLAPISAGPPRKPAEMLASRATNGCTIAQIVTRDGELVTGDGCLASWDFSDRVVPEGETIARLEQVAGRRFTVSTRGELFVSDQAAATPTKVEGLSEVSEIAVDNGGAYVIAAQAPSRRVVAYIGLSETVPLWISEIPGTSDSSKISLIYLPSRFKEQLCLTRNGTDRLCRDADGGWNEAVIPGTDAVSSGRSIRWVQAHGEGDSVLVQSANGLIQRSRDLGRTWSPVGEKMRFTGGLKRDGESGRTCAMRSASLFCSDDDGGTWVEVEAMGEASIDAFDLPGGAIVASSAGSILGEYEVIAELRPHVRQVIDPTTGKLIPGVSEALSRMFSKPLSEMENEIFLLVPSGGGARDIEERRTGEAIAAWFSADGGVGDERARTMESAMRGEDRRIAIILARRR